MDIVARWPGSSHDSHIFNNSTLKLRFENGEFRDRVLLGDSGYPLKDYLMTPIPQPQTPAEELYNRSHISTRSIIERTFGIMKRRFPILSCGMRCKLPLAQRIILASAVLHNIAVLNRDILDDEGEWEEGDGNILVEERYDGIQLRRQTFINYFQTIL